jgi:hypothetical protein
MAPKKDKDKVEKMTGDKGSVDVTRCQPTLTQPATDAVLQYLSRLRLLHYTRIG